MDLTTPSVIFRHQSDTNVGIQTVRYGRNAIGYIEQGTKLIHLADKYVTVQAGELFHISRGTHYIENSPEDTSRPFRQTLFFYTPADLRNDFTPPESITPVNHLCGLCRNSTDVYTYPAWPVVENFFHSLQHFIASQIHLTNPELGHIKLCELVQLLLSRPGCCICRPVCMALSDGPHTLPEVVRENILTGRGLQELAAVCGMSLSMFKNEFRRNFHTSPHKWLNEQRLAHARLQLITSSRSIAEIARECRFNNASHFIKLFRERFGITPATYRRSYDEKN